MAFYSLMFLAFAEHFIISTGESFLIIAFCCVGAYVCCRCLYLCTLALMNVSETEQVLYSSGEISSCADEGLKVRLLVSEAH